MENKKLIRFVESFILLPFVTVSFPGALPVKDIQVTPPQAVLSQQENNNPLSLFAFNQVAIDEEETPEELHAKVLQTRAQAIDAFFKGRNAPLAGYGMKMAEEADKNGLDWRLLPGIATIESNAGKQACKKATHSFLGWGSCKINFESKEKAIEIVARNLGGNNPKTARYYKTGMPLVKLLKTYNPPSIVPDYSDKVIKVMNLIGPENLGENIDITKTEA